MKNFVAISLLLCLSQTYGQSPWPQKKGKAYTQLSFTLISGYEELYGNPDYTTERVVTDNTLQFYGEYGLTDKTSLVLSLPFKFIKTGNLTNTNLIAPSAQEGSKSTLGNIEAGLKHVFFQKKWIISGQFNVEANTGSFDGVSGIRTGYDAWNFTPLILAGRSYGNTYLQGHFGANIRTNNHSSNIRIGGEIGTKALKNIWVIGFIGISSSLKNGDVVLPASNLVNGLYVNDQEFGVLGFKAIAEFSKSFGANFSLGGAFFGNNVAKTAALTFGLYHKF
ncbi:MAG: hypothetical protein GKR88_01995 [Flavobacteriaceae bacterium]|nr:MAG: hypothetical protein GKR88_01995 [Flavobacteriaceae bacterium]